MGISASNAGRIAKGSAALVACSDSHLKSSMLYHDLQHPRRSHSAKRTSMKGFAISISLL
jgi:hypothetical protein